MPWLVNMVHPCDQKGCTNKVRRARTCLAPQCKVRFARCELHGGERWADGLGANHEKTCEERVSYLALRESLRRR